MQQPFATAISVDPHLKNGFYLFENQIYLSKIEALIAATKKQSDIQYYYNDHIYNTVDWKHEPYEPLDNLYKKQAQHIRDSYDHVILMYSGGSDSTTVVHSFLSNNIKPDEIWSLVAYTNTCGETDIPNIEITNAAWPVLERAVAQGVKVELVNQVNFDQPLDEEWWVNAPAARLAHDSAMRKNLFFNNPKIKKLVDQGKKVAFVFGWDKPRLLLDQNQWYVGILDTFWSMHWKDQHSLTNGPFVECFYYSPDVPEILSKSCHILIKHFESMWTADQCRAFFNSDNCRAGPVDIELYRQQVNIALYNHCWDELNTFSLGKNQGRFRQIFCQKCSFVIDHSNHWDNYDTWSRGIEQIQNLIDPKFYTPWTEIGGHWSNLYPIKKLKA